MCVNVVPLLNLQVKGHFEVRADSAVPVCGAQLSLFFKNLFLLIKKVSGFLTRFASVLHFG